jgi:hypothetical protein
MGNYIPCRTRDDDDSHLHVAGEPDRALCGKTVDRPTNLPGGHEVCVRCAKSLLARVFKQTGSGGIASIEVTAH